MGVFGDVCEVVGGGLVLQTALFDVMTNEINI